MRSMRFWSCPREDWTDLPTDLPQVLSCKDCRALVVEANRGEHYSWHIWLNERTWDNETLASYRRAWHAEEREEEVGDEELD